MEKQSRNLNEKFNDLIKQKRNENEALKKIAGSIENQILLDNNKKNIKPDNVIQKKTKIHNEKTQN